MVMAQAGFKKSISATVLADPLISFSDGIGKPHIGHTTEAALGYSQLWCVCKQLCNPPPSQLLLLMMSVILAVAVHWLLS